MDAAFRPSQSAQSSKTDFFTPGGIETTLDSSNCTDDLISPRGWRGIGLAAYGRNWENNYLLINDLYWQPGGAHMRRWETSSGLNGFYSRLNYFSLAIVPSRGACAMSTICGLNTRSKVLRHLHSSKMPWDAGRFSIFKMFQKLSYWGTASPFTSDYTWNLSSFYFFSVSLRLKKKSIMLMLMIEL